ncbi:MAG: YfhO family protein [Ignavibacteriales bacterium]|nr:YfhO family protein [Ignavibacteriales bacterium]
MAKKTTTVKEIRKKEKEPIGFDLDANVPAKYLNLSVIGLIIVIFLIFLSPLFFQGKIFQSGDIIASESATSYLQKAREGFTLWNPHIFTGMPAYALSVGYTWFNLIYVALTSIRELFVWVFGNDFVRWAFYLIVLGITTFYLMKMLTKNTMVSLFSSLATALSTGLVVFLYIGHVTKLTSLAFFPVIFLILLRNQQKFRLIDFFILTIALQLIVQGFHVQIIFYILFTVGIFFLFYITRSLIIKDNGLLKTTVKSALLFTGASLIAIGIQADNLTQIYEYTPHSTRGTASILDKSAQSGGEEDKSKNSEYYKYHTDWSFSPGEVMTFIIPSWYGFGNSDQIINGEKYKLNTYFGQMPFVDVAMYMGVLVFFLALFGMVSRWREPFVMFLTILTSIALLISFGRNFPLFFDLLFNYFPNFDKFRVPSMILVIPQMVMPILAGLGLMKIVELGKEKNVTWEKVIMGIAGVSSVLFVFSLLGRSGMISWVSNRFALSEKAAQYPKEAISIVGNAAGEMFANDAIINFLIVAVAFWLAWFFIKKRVSALVFTSIIVLLCVADLWRISSRGAEYTDAPSKSIEFAEPYYVKAIKAQKDDQNNPFRILNLKMYGSRGSIQNNGNFNAYFLMEDVYGYSAIKPRPYQDYLDILKTPANETFINMTGTKYLVLDQPGIPFEGCVPVAVDTSSKTFVLENKNALPRAFFVNRVENKKPLEILEMVRDNKFKPQDVAYVSGHDVKVDPIDSTVTSKITKYTDEILELDVNTSGSNFLFFSTTYHKKGWHAYADGKEVEIHIANHNFMGIVVPKGTKKVKFEYAPGSFFIAKYTALTLSSFVVFGLIITLIIGYMKSKKKEEVAE